VATSHAAPGRGNPFGTVRSTARHARPAVFPRALGVAGLATATTVAFLPTGSAIANPDDVERRVQQLDTQASLAVEEFRQAEQQAAEVERRAAVAAEQAAAEQARLDEARTAMSDVVGAAYRRGGNDRLVALVTDKDPQAFLDRAASLDRIAASQADVLAEIETARARAEAQQAQAERQLEALRAAQEQLAERRAQVERTMRAQQALLDGLREQERRQLEAARAAAAAPPRASRSGRDEAPVAAAAAAPTAPTAPTPTYDGPASGRAQVAIDEAHRQLGKPYRYGASGPDAFDCSGFTSWVWRAAGVSLPRTSRDQYAQGRKVARADLQPGDLMFFGSPIHHVGMYLGDGRMIHAPSSGKTVHIASAFRGDYVGATRP
jgi:peptidoglycan DL-endopeptidase CwlO